jgi:hypothetical protein
MLSMVVTSGKQWRKRREEGVEIKFPTTNNIARIRPLDVDFFIKQGRIHNLLESAVFENLTGKEITAYTEDEITAFTTTLDFLDEVARACFVSPKIVDEPTADDEISVKDVTLDEKYFLFGLLVRPAQALDSFRPEQTGDVASVAAAKINGAASEPDHANLGVGESSNGDERRLDSDSV